MAATYRYRRFASNDYSAWSLVDALETRIAGEWRAMHIYRKRAAELRKQVEAEWPDSLQRILNDGHQLQREWRSVRNMAFGAKQRLLMLLEIRREGRS